MADGDDSTAGPTRLERWSSRIASLAGLVWFVGTAVRCSVRDGSPMTAPIFYALPVPVLVCAGLWYLRRVRRGENRRRALILVIAIGTQAIVWGYEAFAWQAGAPENASRLLFWNVCRGNLGYAAIAREIAAGDADIVALVEATQQGQDPDFWDTAVPDYYAYCLGGGMTVLARRSSHAGEVRTIKKGQFPRAFRYRIVELSGANQGRRLRLMIVDVKSDPLTFRRPAFDRIAQIASEFETPDIPLLVVGDFNTPLDSVHVDLLRRELRNAFESSGDGYRETWPVVLPVLSLDQVWGTSGVHWHRCWRESSVRSDHRRVLADFSVDD